jgi:membrane protease YdiL (CAAX protease family)
MNVELKEGQTALEMGIKLKELGEYSRALKHFKKSRKIFNSLKDTVKVGEVLLEIGKTSLLMGDYENSLESFEMGRNIFKENRDPIGEGYALLGFGEIYKKRGYQEESRSYYRKAIQKFNKAGDHEKEAIILSKLANSFESQGAFQDAIYEQNRSMNIYKKIGKKKDFLDAWNKILNLKEKISNYKVSRKNIFILIVYLVLLICAEIFTATNYKEVGFLVHTILIFALLIHSSIASSYTYANLLRSMMILPMIRVMALIPLMQIEPLYWFIIISIPLFAAAFILIRIQGISRRRAGLIWGNIPLQLLIASSGLILGYIEFNILHPLPMIHIFNLENVLLGSLIILIGTGLAEEIIFRGIIQKNAENVLGLAAGLLYTSLVFASLHIGWNSFPDLVFVFSVSIFYGYAFQKTGSLFGITLSHGLSNTVLFLVMPFVI